MPKKPDTTASVGPKLAGADLGLWGKSMPLLADWLCTACWDDGTPIGKTRLSLWRAGTEVVACLQIADMGGVRLEARAEHPQAALGELEQLLGLPAIPWQLDPYPIGQGGKRKKS